MRDIDYMERIIDLVSDLNLLFNDKVHRKFGIVGEFNLVINESIQDGIKFDKIMLDYNEGDDVLPIFYKTIRPDCLNAYKVVYFEILRHVLFSMDSVDKLIDSSDGRRINILSTQTLYNEGLKKIKNT